MKIIANITYHGLLFLVAFLFVAALTAASLVLVFALDKCWTFVEATFSRQDFLQACLYAVAGWGAIDIGRRLFNWAEKTKGPSNE